MNQVALRRLIGGSVLVWVVCTVMLMTHSVPQQQRVGAQEAPTAAATAEGAPEQLARPVYLPLIQRGQGTPPTPEPVPLPDSAATARYARWQWNDFGNFETGDETRFVKRAYARGYNASQGAPESMIILGFGRQLEPGRITSDGIVIEDWSVFLAPDNRIAGNPNDGALRTKDRKWVIEVSEAFIRGYNDNPNHGPTTIAIGTANANFPWSCNNEGFYSGFWPAAGLEWRDMIEEIFVPGNKVTLAGANDIETWDEIDPPWVACGIGAIAWINGYEFATNDTPDKVYLSNIMVNFGNNPWAVDNSAWTPLQVIEVYMGRNFIQGYPQIYCPNQIDQLDRDNDWVGLIRSTPVSEEVENGRLVIRFSGVTADNAGSEACGIGIRSLPWEEAWSEFYTKMSQLEQVNNNFLERSVSSYYLPTTRDDDDIP